MTHDLNKRWLKVTAVVVGSFAPALLLATLEGTAGPVRAVVDAIDWPPDGATTFAATETRFLSALMAGFLTGWAITIWRLGGVVYDAAPDGVRVAVVSGAVGWFVVDSIGSVLSGVPLNVLGNVVILLVAVGPMWRPAQRDVTA